ncbi:MAG: hypothetical protein GWN62_25055, partial [Aliifodinibius sp.]|nr:hypothetical protein [Fodinibius sp.]
MGVYTIQFIGCAPSKPPTGETSESTDEDDMGEIERLLGITEEDKEKKSEDQQTKKEDDDLLTL